MKRWWMVVIGCAVLLASCSGQSTPAPTPTPRSLPALWTDRLGTAQDLIPTEAEIAAAKIALGPQGFIGIVACNLSSEYHAGVPRAAQALAQQWGLPVQVFDSEAKADRQNAPIETFVAKGAKAIALCVIDPNVVGNAVKEAV